MSFSPLFLENWISFRDVRMILLPFFEIPNGYRVAKNVLKLRVKVIPRSMKNPIFFINWLWKRNKVLGIFLVLYTFGVFVSNFAFYSFLRKKNWIFFKNSWTESFHLCSFLSLDYTQNLVYCENNCHVFLLTHTAMI